MRCYFSTVSLRSHFKAHMNTHLRTDLRGRCRVFERIQPAALFVLLRPVGPPRACWCLLSVSDAMWHCAAERQSGERGGGSQPHLGFKCSLPTPRNSPNTRRENAARGQRARPLHVQTPPPWCSTFLKRFLFFFPAMYLITSTRRF